MKKPRIAADEPQPRKIIRADKAPTSGYSLVVDGHFKSHHETVEAAEEAGMALKNLVPDASGAGLRRREQDAVADRLAGPGVTRSNSVAEFSGSASTALLVRQPVGQRRRFFVRRLRLGADLLGRGRRAEARPLRARAATPSASPYCRARLCWRRRGRPCRTSRPAPPLSPCRRAPGRDHDPLWSCQVSPFSRSWPCAWP